MKRDPYVERMESHVWPELLPRPERSALAEIVMQNDWHRFSKIMKARKPKSTSSSQLPKEIPHGAGEKKARNPR